MSNHSTYIILTMIVMTWLLPGAPTPFLMADAVETNPAVLELVDHGIASPVSTSRGAIAMLDDQGKPLVLALVTDASEASLLVVDPVSGETEQYFGHKAHDTFSVMLSSRNRLYVMFGPVLHEFDVKERRWTARVRVPGGRAFSYAEGPDGKIYAGLHPSCNLIRFDPETKQVETLVKLHEVQKYPLHLQVADDGWVYAGVGPAQSDLVAYHLESGELHSLGDKGTAALGYGQVWWGRDGLLYGNVGGESPWMVLSGGKGTVVDNPAERDLRRSIYFQRISSDFGNGWILEEWDAIHRRLVIRKDDGSREEIPVDYRSNGANITSLSKGPGGVLHGSTSHPMTWFTMEDGNLLCHGHIPKIGGGNICAFAAVGDVMYGAAYHGGYLYAFDTSLPWDLSAGDDGNPRLLGVFGRGTVEEQNMVSRPRVLHRHGKWLIMGGFPGYGLVGGGLVFYDTETGEIVQIRNENLIEGHSTITLCSVGDTLIGGTSIHAPGGADPVDSDARIYHFDVNSHRVVFSMVPFKGETEIRSLRVDGIGLVWGLTENSKLFAYDPDDRVLLDHYDLSEYGSPLFRDQSLLLDDNGDVIVLLSDAILRIEPEEGKPELICRTPMKITAGGAFIDGRLYFGSGSHVWSVKLD